MANSSSKSFRTPVSDTDKLGILGRGYHPDPEDPDRGLIFVSFALIPVKIPEVFPLPKLFLSRRRKSSIAKRFPK
jgi:hypothetical protein